MSTTYSNNEGILIYRNGTCQAKRFIEHASGGFLTDNTVRAKKIIETLKDIELEIDDYTNQPEYRFARICEIDLTVIPKLCTGPEFNSLLKDIVISGSVKQIIFNPTLTIPDNVAYSIDLSENQDDSIIGFTTTANPYVLNITTTSYPNIILANEDSSHMFDGFNTVQLIDIKFLKTLFVKDFSYFCKGCSSLISINSKYLDTVNCLYMDYMFAECSSLQVLDVSGFRNTNTISMSYMFYKDIKLRELNISNMSNASLENIDYMYAYCESLTSICNDMIQYPSVLSSMDSAFIYCNLTTRNSILFDTESEYPNSNNIFANASGFDLYSNGSNGEWVQDLATIYDIDDQSKIIYIGDLRYYVNENEFYFSDKDGRLFVEASY